MHFFTLCLWYVRFFLTVFLTVFFCTFWSWGFLGIPLDPKTCKNFRFFKVFEHAAFWLFEAPDGSLGSSLPIFAKIASDLWSRKCCKTGPSHLSKSIWLILQKNTQKKNGQYWLLFWSIFGNNFGAHFGTRSAKVGARWAQESHQEFKEPKSCIFKNLKKPSVF